jgi:ParB/RepB/Spo0J family partition protein
MTPVSLSIHPDHIQPSPTNPRKHFNEEQLVELAENIKTHGLLQALLVRPRWCVGAGARSALNGRRNADDAPFEIVAGERRFRAAKMAGLESIPCSVRELTDSEAMEIQLVENLQRTDLTPIEEAHGFKSALELQIDGKPVHTVESLADRIRKSAAHIYAQLKLNDLPKFLLEAVDDGILPVNQAVALARIPDKAKRTEAGKLVLHGHGENSPLSKQETKDLLRRDFMRELKGAPFNQEAQNPVAGPCSSCPYRSANIADFDGGRGDICTNPGCFERKAQWAFDRLASEAAKEGKTVLPADQAARHFDALGELRFDSPLVRLNQRPAEHLLKPEVKKAPKWADLVAVAREKKLTVPVLLAQNPKTGVVEELIDRNPLIAAAAKIGEPIFRESAPAKPKVTDPADARIAEEKKKSEEQLALALHALGKLIDLLYNDATGAWYIDALVGAFVDAANFDGQWMLVKLFKLKPASGAFGYADAVSKWLRGQSPQDREAACMGLLVAGEMRTAGIHAIGFQTLAHGAGIDLAKLEQDWRASKKAAKTSKPKPAAKPKLKAAVKKKGGNKK